MNTETISIDILRIQHLPCSYLVSYWDEEFEGENINTIQIDHYTLMDYIVSNDLNMIEVPCPYAGIDQKYLSAESYLEDNLHDTVKDFITENS